MLDYYRFCKLPDDLMVYPDRSTERVIFRCESGGLEVELSPVEALILAARLAFVARQNMPASAAVPEVQRQFRLVRAET
jgi:hypothetical protein